MKITIAIQLLQTIGWAVCSLLVCTPMRRGKRPANWLLYFALLLDWRGGGAWYIIYVTYL